MRFPVTREVEPRLVGATLAASPCVSVHARGERNRNGAQLRIASRGLIRQCRAAETIWKPCSSVGEVSSRARLPLRRRRRSARSHHRARPMWRLLARGRRGVGAGGRGGGGGGGFWRLGGGGIPGGGAAPRRR